MTSDVAEPASTRSTAPGLSRQGPYGPVGPRARLTWLAATPFVQLALYLAANFLAVAIVGKDALDALALPQDRQFRALALTTAISFPLWAVLVAAWTVLFERRSLASMGFRGGDVLRRYGTGLVTGLGIALLLALVSAVVAPEELKQQVAPAAGFEPGRILRGDWLTILAGVSAFFLVQGACEEIAFRGWMMSAVAARRGLLVGVLLNSVVFGALHVVQLLVSGALTAGVGFVAITLVGVFLSLWAIRDRSVVGACGVHSGFNLAVVASGLVAVAASNPDASPTQALFDTFSRATGLDGQAGASGAAVQLAVFAALVGLMIVRLRKAQ